MGLRKKSGWSINQRISPMRREPGNPLTVRWLWSTAAVMLVALAFPGCGSRDAGAGLERFSKVGAFSLTERNGATVTNTNLQGKIWVAHFFYSKCGSECKVLGRRMESIQKLTEGDDDVMLVSMSVDPVNDTPEYLRYYADEFNASEDRWLFLTGDKIALYNLIIDSFLLPAAPELLSRDDFPRNFIHSEKFAVVDRFGFVRAYFDGMDRETPQAVFETIQLLRNEFRGEPVATPPDENR